MGIFWCPSFKAHHTFAFLEGFESQVKCTFTRQRFCYCRRFNFSGIAAALVLWISLISGGEPVFVGLIAWRVFSSWWLLLKRASHMMLRGRTREQALQTCSPKKIPQTWIWSSPPRSIFIWEKLWLGGSEASPPPGEVVLDWTARTVGRKGSRYSSRSNGVVYQQIMRLSPMPNSGLKQNWIKRRHPNISRKVMTAVNVLKLQLLLRRYISAVAWKFFETARSAKYIVC